MIVVVLVLVCAGLWVAPAWLAAPVGWVLFGYLLTRAWPAVRADLAGLRLRRQPWRRGRGGAHL